MLAGFRSRCSAAAVHLAQAVEHAAEHLAHESLGQPAAVLAEVIAQGVADLVAHHQIDGLVGAEEVQHAHHVGMVQPGQRPALLEEQLQAMVEIRLMLRRNARRDRALGAQRQGIGQDRHRRAVAVVGQVNNTTRRTQFSLQCGIQQFPDHRATGRCFEHIVFLASTGRCVDKSLFVKIKSGTSIEHFSMTCGCHQRKRGGDTEIEIKANSLSRPSVSVNDVCALEPDLRAAVITAITAARSNCASVRPQGHHRTQALNLPLLTGYAPATRGRPALRQRAGDDGNRAARWPGVIEEAQIGRSRCRPTSPPSPRAPWPPSSPAASAGAALEAMLTSHRRHGRHRAPHHAADPQVVSAFQQKAVERMQDAGPGLPGLNSALSRQDALERIRQR